MANYSDLQLGHFYLIIENENDEIQMVEPILLTDNCVLLLLHDEFENTIWRKLSDSISEMLMN